MSAHTHRLMPLEGKSAWQQTLQSPSWHLWDRSYPKVQLPPLFVPIHRSKHVKATLSRWLSSQESDRAHLILAIRQSTAGLIVITKYLWLAADKSRKWNNSSFTCINSLWLLTGALRDPRRTTSAKFIEEIYRRNPKPLLTSEIL